MYRLSGAAHSNLRSMWGEVCRGPLTVALAMLVALPACASRPDIVGHSSDARAWSATHESTQPNTGANEGQQRLAAAWATESAADPRPAMPTERPSPGLPPPADIPSNWKMRQGGGDVHVLELSTPESSSTESASDTAAVIGIVAAVAVFAVVAAALAGSHGSGSVSIGGGYGNADVLLFGGRGHRVFLGCLSCSELDHNSVLNDSGPYGGEYGDTIFNRFSDYGSAFSEYSACNEFASDPPVIVTDRGQYLGRLTVSEFRGDSPYEPTLNGWIRAVCTDH
jgi:hypothetical protein